MTKRVYPESLDYPCIRENYEAFGEGMTWNEYLSYIGTKYEIGSYCQLNIECLVVEGDTLPESDYYDHLKWLWEANDFGKVYNTSSLRSEALEKAEVVGEEALRLFHQLQYLMFQREIKARWSKEYSELSWNKFLLLELGLREVEVEVLLHTYRSFKGLWTTKDYGNDSYSTGALKIAKSMFLDYVETLPKAKRLWVRLNIPV